MAAELSYTKRVLTTKNESLIQKYWKYCDKQPAALWFILPIFIFPCVIFTIGFFIQYLNNQPEIWYFTICGISLYTNILPNFAEANTRVTITNFILTLILQLILWLFLIF